MFGISLEASGRRKRSRRDPLSSWYFLDGPPDFRPFAARELSHLDASSSDEKQVDVDDTTTQLNIDETLKRYAWQSWYEEPAVKKMKTDEDQLKDKDQSVKRIIHDDHDVPVDALLAKEKEESEKFDAEIIQALAKR